MPGFHPSATPDKLASFEIPTCRSLHTKEEILMLADSCADSLVQYGREVGLEGPAERIADVTRAADPSVLICAGKAADLALNIYSREDSIGR